MHPLSLEVCLLHQKQQEQKRSVFLKAMAVFQTNQEKEETEKKIALAKAEKEEAVMDEEAKKTDKMVEKTRKVMDQMDHMKRMTEMATELADMKAKRFRDIGRMVA